MKNLTLQYYPSTAKYPKGELRCDGVKCINVTKRCDGEADCAKAVRMRRRIIALCP